MITLVIYLLGMVWTYAFSEYMTYASEDIFKNMDKARLYLIILWPLLMMGLLALGVKSLIAVIVPKIELPEWIKDKLDRE